MQTTEELTLFGKLLTRYQSRIYAFIVSVVGNREVALEVFQETNLVLWRKAAEFDRSREFLPWAFAIARNQVLAARKRTGRDRLLFDESAMERLAALAIDRTDRIDDRQVALANCLERLPLEQKKLIERRYRNSESVGQIAAATRRSANSVAVLIFRIRQSLAQCIAGQLEATATR